jgi:hypothetical protein
VLTPAREAPAEATAKTATCSRRYKNPVHAGPESATSGLVLASNADGTAEVTIESPQQRVAERETAAPFRPTNLMEKVSKYIEGGGEADSQNDILKA